MVDTSANNGRCSHTTRNEIYLDELTSAVVSPQHRHCFPCMRGIMHACLALVVSDGNSNDISRTGIDPGRPDVLDYVHVHVPNGGGAASRRIFPGYEGARPSGSWTVRRPGAGALALMTGRLLSSQLCIPARSLTVIHSNVVRVSRWLFRRSLFADSWLF